MGISFTVVFLCENIQFALMTSPRIATGSGYLMLIVSSVNCFITIWLELVGIRCGDRQMLSTCNRMNVCEDCSLFYSYIYISWNSDFFCK